MNSPFRANTVFENKNARDVLFFAQTVRVQPGSTRLHGLWVLRSDMKLLAEDTILVSADRYSEWRNIPTSRQDVLKVR